MYMTANRRKRDNKPYLKLNMHEFSEEDIPFLDSLGITKEDDELPGARYINVYSQQDFLDLREKIFTEYKVLKETGPRVFLERI